MTEPAEASAADLDIVADLTVTRSRQVCSIERLREGRPDLAGQFDRALAARPRFSDTRIANWITTHGFPISDSSIRSHRIGECQRCQTTSSPT